MVYFSRAVPYIAIRKKEDSWIIFSYLKHYFICFNVNQYLAVSFVELGRGGFRVSYIWFFLFTLDHFSEHSHSHAGLILLIARNILLLAFCFLSVCIVDQTQTCPSSISPLRLFGGTWEPLNYWKDLIWKGGPQTPLPTMPNTGQPCRLKYL